MARKAGPTEEESGQIKYERDLAAKLRRLRNGESGSSTLVISEINEMYFFLWKKLALRNCGRLAHRGAPCGGTGRPSIPLWVAQRDGVNANPEGGARTVNCAEWSDETRFAYRAIIEAYRDAVIGRPQGVGGNRKTKGKVSLLEIWDRGEPKFTFSTYFSRSGLVGNEEALRQWNSARGLPVRFARPKKVMSELRNPMTIIWAAISGSDLTDVDFEALNWPEGDIDAPILRLLIDQIRPAARVAGLDSEDGWYLLARSLWWDACQAPAVNDSFDAEPFDRDRVARHLRWSLGLPPLELTKEHLAATAEVGNFFDYVAQIVSQPWWEKWIDHPRRLTHDVSRSALSGELGELAIGRRRVQP